MKSFLTRGGRTIVVSVAEVATVEVDLDVATGGASGGVVDVEAAFVEAVRRNITDGLALTTRARVRAAQRVLSCREEWSDRAISEVCGLSPGTIGRLRSEQRRATGESPLTKRIGRDGRKRPVNAGMARMNIINAARNEYGDDCGSTRSLSSKPCRHREALPAVQAPCCGRSTVGVEQLHTCV
jgi:hypothetical protein